MKTKRMIRLWLPLGLTIAGASGAWAAGPGTLKFDQSSFEFTEAAGMAVITVERSQGEDGTVSVDYATGGGSATAGSDYTPVSGTLTWGDGDEASKSFLVPIVDDGAAEGAETVELTLNNATGGASIDSQRGTAVLVILANDGGSGGDDPPGDDPPGDDPPGDDPPGDDPPGDDGGGAGVFKFDERNVSAVELAGMAVISVERSHGESGAVSVDYATSPGTATAGADYTPTSGTLNWASGDGSSKVFMVPIANDGVEEGSETVHLALSNPTGGASLDAERATAVLTIVDDDQGAGQPGDDNGLPGTFKFDERTFQVIEGAPSVVITVERSRGEAGAVSVRYSASDGSAHDGMDYQAVSGILSWGSGDDGVKSFTVPIFDDSADEGNETVNLTLSDPSGGALLDPERSVATLTILDDDGSTAACTPGATTLCLAQGRFEVEVEWRSPQGGVGHGGVDQVSDDSGLVWFFNSSNKELLIKVLDACQPFGRFWVFFAATTNVDFTVTVTDTATGLVKQYTNPLGQAATPVQDTFTFEGCP